MVCASFASRFSAFASKRFQRFHDSFANSGSTPPAGLPKIATGIPLLIRSAMYCLSLELRCDGVWMINKSEATSGSHSRGVAESTGTGHLITEPVGSSIHSLASRIGSVWSTCHCMASREYTKVAPKAYVVSRASARAALRFVESNRTSSAVSSRLPWFAHEMYMPAGIFSPFGVFTAACE